MKMYLSILCSLILILTLTACNSGFDGSRTGNESRFIMEYKIFNTTDSQSLELEAGDIIEAEIVNDAGRLSIKVQKDGNEPIYENDNVLTSTFQIEINESGTYKVTVAGKKSKGSISFTSETDIRLSDMSQEEILETAFSALHNADGKTFNTCVVYPEVRSIC